MFHNQKFNVYTFLLLFILLYYSYVFFIGLITPGGLYIPFLERYFNIPAWLTYGICSAAKFLLRLADYDAYQKAPNNVSIHGGRGVNIIWACLGFGVMSCWTAFVAAHNADRSYKIKWATIGISSIILLNIIRIASIPLAFFYHWDRYNAIDVHFIFNVASYGVIVLLAVLFIRSFNRHWRKALLYIDSNTT